ncbi:replicative DNA helicase [Nevskia soli]|uniref:replicative DNA helicase n=1 Tax=Nevskia soli TaxID=418856 RepID=UPI00068BF2A0|nr:replicative DNA helicase [Nevskia soli]
MATPLQPVTLGGGQGKLAPSPKQPPHSMEAEQSVLGGLLLNNRAWYDLVDQVSEEDFYTQDHRVIFRAIGELMGQGKPCDFVTLSEHLRQQNKLDDAGGVSYLGTLAADTPSAANVKAYAEIVRERSVLRALIATGQDVAELGYQPAGRHSGTLIDVAEQQIFAIRARGSKAASQVKGMPVLMDAIEDRLERLRANPDAFAGTPTGFIELDKMTQGMHEADLIIVGGRPGMGKTSFAMNIAEHVAIERKLPTVVFSMEMSAEQLALRVLSSFGRIDQQALRSGHLEDHDWSRLVSASGLLREAPLFIDETGSLSPQELAGRARRLAAKHPLALIVVDYIQLMQVPNNRENRTNEISEISRSLKALAKELKVPIIALSQLSRTLESRTDKRPIMSDLRESGSIEQDADVVLFVYRDDYHNKESLAPGTAEIIIAKQRSGPTGKVKTAFLGKYTRFDNLAPEYAYNN